MVPLAPNPTKVMLYIAEREQMGSWINVQQIKVNTLKGLHKEPEYMTRNPFGTLPILELEDGSYLRESLTIIDYLEVCRSCREYRTLTAALGAKGDLIYSRNHSFG